MNRLVLPLALAAALVPGLAAADKTTVYRTKNADGTTTYSQIETQGATAREVGGRDPDVAAAPAAGEAAAPKTEAQQACERGKLNLEMLSSSQPISRDKDGDGTAEVLTPEERASETDLAQRQVTAYCTEG